MKQTIYLIGQISVDASETYEWRKRIRDNFLLDDINIIDPCDTGFNIEVLNEFVGRDIERLEVYKKMGVDILVPKDKNYVYESNIGIANMNTYDPKKPFIGTMFELAWYYADPNKTVIGIYSGDRTKDINANHPFVRAAVTTWVNDEVEACELVRKFFL